MKDTIQTIRHSSRHFFSGALLSRLTGMARDMLMAYAFGTQPSIAAFMVAFRFAHLLRRLFGEGALQTAFIPTFENLRHQEQERALTFFRDLQFTLSFFLTLLIGLVGALLAGWMKWGNLSADNQEILSLTLAMLPSLLFICLFGLNASLLNCEKKYFISSVAPVAFNSIWIAAVLFLKHMPAQQAMPWLAYAVVLACLCQWLLTVPPTWKSFHSFSLPRFRLFKASSDLSLLYKPLALAMIGVAASQVNNAVDSVFARFADSAGPAFLWYAMRLYQLPLALFGIAIAGAVLPPLARACKAEQWDTYHHFLQDAFYRTWMFMLPLTALLFMLGDTSVQFLYGRGDFGISSVMQTTYCLWAYGAGLIPSAFILILAPAYYAQGNYRLPVSASFVSLFVNLFLNALFVMGLNWGAMSIAFATSLSAWINYWLLGRNLAKKGAQGFAKPLLKRGFTMLFASLGACWGTYHVRVDWQQLPFFSHSLLSFSLSEQFLALIIQLLSFGGFLLFNFYLLSFIHHFIYDILLSKKTKVKQTHLIN